MYLIVFIYKSFFAVIWGIWQFMLFSVLFFTDYIFVHYVLFILLYVLFLLYLYFYYIYNQKIRALNRRESCEMSFVLSRNNTYE